jgi:small subunit ribosomal protein S16
MSVVKIRLARGGAKKKPHYSIVVARATAPRDGAFIEKIGYYDPLLSSDNPARVVINLDRAEHWLGVGAQPTEKVAYFIESKGGNLTSKIKAKVAERFQKRSLRSARKKEAN